MLHILIWKNQNCVSIVDDASDKFKENFLYVSLNQEQSATKHTQKQEEFQQCNSCLEPKIATSGVVSDEWGDMKSQNEDTSLF